MNRDTCTIPKIMVYSLLARVGASHQPPLDDPLPRLSPEQLTEMVQAVVHAQGTEGPDLSPEELAIKKRLLAETRQIKLRANDSQSIGSAV
jgi:hypothetical protein